MAASDWIGFLDYSPEAAYYSSPMGQEFAGTTPTAQRYYEKSFSDMYNQWLGELGKRVRGGEDPFSLPFRSYLDPEEGDNPFTSRYTQTYKSLAPSARGSYTGAYAPRTRQIYF